MALRPAAHVAAKRMAALSKLAHRGLRTSARATQVGGVRSIQQAVAREPAVDMQAMAPLPLTMLTEEETMFKDSGAFGCAYLLSLYRCLAGTWTLTCNA